MLYIKGRVKKKEVRVDSHSYLPMEVEISFLTWKVGETYRVELPLQPLNKYVNTGAEGFQTSHFHSSKKTHLKMLFWRFYKFAIFWKQRWNRSWLERNVDE